VDVNQQRGRAQIEILGRLGDEGFDMLLKGLRSETFSVYYACLNELQRKKDRGAIDPLIALAREFPDRAAQSISAIARLEEGRETVDKRVVEFLASLLEKRDTPQHVRAESVSALASLNAAEALPTVEKELDRILEEMPEYPDDTRRLAAVEALYAIDLMTRAGASKLDEMLNEVMSRMGEFDVFVTARELARQLDVGTLTELAERALEMIKAEPTHAWKQQGPGRQDDVYFLQHMASSFPNVLLEEGNRKRLHELLDSQLTWDQRLGLAEIARKIRDEETIPFLLKDLNPFRTQSWDDFALSPNQAYDVFNAVWLISPERGQAFLLEKLKSEEMAWVGTAAELLGTRGDRKAAEALAERYREIKSRVDAEASEEGTQPPAPEQAVMEVIRSAYRELTGKDMEGDGEEKKEGTYTFWGPPGGGRLRTAPRD